ncbi:hypothetical protein VC83_01620 [Pseudogymnoascus destructans]|uniref:Uncharacterized protein n=1 Tax=Pseudogymnoascus destructans TaxID=655981 RepID=A0A177ALE9_9PEZI|nr:uncharacterized protein VC83_01620 [Pseudogymnoascus destructans]OAF61994.1 hypothetical protein VC83_01620 [Pseudogymnoascus destructans]
MAAPVIWNRLSKVIKSIGVFKEDKVFVRRIVLLVPGDILTAEELLRDEWLLIFTLNLILQHASIDTFLKTYLDRNINVDVQNIYRGLESQKALMRFACLIS